MPERIRWGILGTGSIARQFATGLGALPDAEIKAVGSRKAETADAFADEYQVPKRHGSYEALAADPDVDVIYVATPHPMHKDDTILCLEAGKPVLCEKPFTLNARDTAEVIACAREKKLFLMEAMWTRYLPVMIQVRKWLADGAIGDVQILQVEFGFQAGFDAESRLFDPKLGGGALMDVGIYTVSLASMVFGCQPARIASMAHLCATGVDDQAAMLFGYEGGAFALLSTSLRTSTVHEATIIGSKGNIRIHPMFWRATKATLTVGRHTVTADMPHDGNGYNYEAAEVMRCLRAGELESPTIPLDESIEIMKTMDEVRKPWGVRYPAE